MVRRRPGLVWLGILSAVGAVIASGLVAVAAVTVSTPKRAIVLCQAYGRHTVQSRGTEYFVRNDVFTPERECIELSKNGLGFTVSASHAHSTHGDTDAFPEVVYGCEWGACTPGSQLPRRVYRLRSLSTSWSTSWRRAPGHFDVGYDDWFGYLHTTNGQSKGAELMIWLGTKGFGTPYGDPIVKIDRGPLVLRQASGLQSIRLLELRTVPPGHHDRGRASESAAVHPLRAGQGTDR